MLMNPAYAPPGQPATVKHVFAREEFAKRSPECSGCPYGDRQHCVGICWRDTYSNKPRVEGIKTTEVTVIR